MLGNGRKLAITAQIRDNVYKSELRFSKFVNYDPENRLTGHKFYYVEAKFQIREIPESSIYFAENREIVPDFDKSTWHNKNTHRFLYSDEHHCSKPSSQWILTAIGSNKLSVHDIV